MSLFLAGLCVAAAITLLTFAERFCAPAPKRDPWIYTKDWRQS
jgi:hypothetical protein